MNQIVPQDMPSNVVVYRTAFPIYSEAFLVQQVLSYCYASTVVFVRNAVSSAPAGIRMRDVGGRFNAATFSLFGSLKGFGDLTSLKGSSVVHAHFAPDGLFAIPIATAIDAPLVVTCHGSDVTRTAQSRLPSLKANDVRWWLGRARLKRRATRFIAVSDFVKEKMQASGFPAQKIVRHYIGVDIERFAPTNETKGGAQYILCVARHQEVKGVDLLLRAYAVCRERAPQLRLVLIGSGTETPSLRRLCGELGIMDGVEFLGARSHDEVLKVMQRAAIVVLSSRRARDGAEEALGIVLVEAAACGIPCVGTRVGGIPEVIKHEVTGLIAEAEDVSDLANCISRILEEPALAARMGVAARARAADLFDIRKQADSLRDIYQGAWQEHLRSKVRAA